MTLFITNPCLKSALNQLTEVQYLLTQNPGNGDMSSFNNTTRSLKQTLLEHWPELVKGPAFNGAWEHKDIFLLNLSSSSVPRLNFS